MARPPKKKPRKDQRYEKKKVVGHKPDGSPIRKSFYSRISGADAEKQANDYKLEREIANRTGLGFIDNNVLFDVWARKWLDVYIKPDKGEDSNSYRFTYENTVENHLIPYFGQNVIGQIENADIKNFFNTKNKYSESMLKKMKMCLNGIFLTAIENRKCSYNPMYKVRFESKFTKNPKTALSDEQINFLETRAEKDMPEIVVMLETGIRRGEMPGLMWSEIDTFNEIYSVNRNIATIKGGGLEINPPKWDSYRTNPMTPKTAEIFRKLPHNSIYVFPNQDGNLQNPRTWAQKFDRFIKQIRKENPSFPRITPHDLRHTCGTYLRRHGADLYDIKELLGHKDINVTANTYVHNEVDVLRGVINLIGRKKQLSKTGKSVVKVSSVPKLKQHAK